MIHTGDCVEVMRTLPDASVDAVVTDPPYGLEFMGKEWDRIVPNRGRHSGTERKTFSAGGRNFPSDRRPQASFATQSQNPKCENCGKYRWDHEDRKCSCDKPTFRHRHMGAEQQAFHFKWATEAFRVLKPGGYLLAFGGTRTVHRLASAIEDAGFEIRDELVWIYASGFPKSLDVSKALDKVAGAERETGKPGPYDARRPVSRRVEDGGDAVDWHYGDGQPITAPATDLARQWQGWGTALKPAHEPIVMARKPLQGTVAANVTRWGTGALNIDGTRIPGVVPQVTQGVGEPTSYQPRKTPALSQPHDAGRWPSNVLLSDPELFDQSNPYVVGSGATVSSGNAFVGQGSDEERSMFGGLRSRVASVYADSGGYSRFFIIPKADRAEREPVITPDGHDKTTRFTSHPTVKPVDLMRHLVRLVTPPRVNALYCTQCERRYGRPNLPPVRASLPTEATATVLLGDVPGRIPEAGEEVRPVRGDVLDEGPDVGADLLLEGVRGSGASAAGHDLSGVREGVPGQAGGSGESVLLEGVRGEGDGPEPSGLDEERGGVHPGVEPGPSERGEVGLRDAAPSSDGRRSGKAADRRGSRGSHQRAEGRQSASEPSGADEASPRQPAEAAAQADHLPSLPVDDLPFGSCSACGGRIAAGERPGLVLDPFGGSGTTALACELEGFDWILVEREPEYVAIAEARLNGTQRGLGLDVPAPTRKRQPLPTDQQLAKKAEKYPGRIFGLGGEEDAA